LLVTYESSFDEQVTDLGNDLELLDDTGASVPISRTRSGADILLAPAAPLQPKRTYRISDRRHVPCDITARECGATNAPEVFATFTTAAGLDTIAPANEGLVSTTPGERLSCHGGSCCGDREEVPIQFLWSTAQDNVAGDDVRYHVYRKQGSSLVPVARFQKKSDIGFTGWQTCEGTPAGSAELTPGSYVVHAVDWAGNEDANTATRSFGDQCDGFPGCAVAPDASRGGWPVGPIAAAIAFALAILRSARRPRKTA
jgi:hypothetical protein